MQLWKWLMVVVSSPFWFPVVLFCVGFCILVFGSILAVSLALSLGLIIWILKIFYVTYIGLIRARQEVIRDIDKGLSGVPWWRLLRLTLNKHREILRTMKQIRKDLEKAEEINEEEG